ncbi:MAG TPA: hypothetical protein VMR52_07455 [Dehalococcoidia bacterium]|nr:hypothetical protein [Dehalococcoidia bacterium]
MPDATLDLFLYWLRETFGRGFTAPDHHSAVTIARDGDYSIAIAARSLVSHDDAKWVAVRARLEEQIADGVPARIALWVPAGATLPAEEPAASEFADRVRQAALKLGPHERSYVPLPAVMRLRKNSSEGGVVSATGGLNPHWASFTGRVQGAYDLDSTAVHRLPESEGHLEKLLDRVVETAREMDEGEVREIETIDAWTVQRLSGDSGCTIIGLPVDATNDLGLAVRRNFRRFLLDAAPLLRDAEADLRALLVTGHYPRVEMEGATTALRGYDPTSYSGLDFICLVTDGLVKPLIQPPDHLLPWEKTGSPQ